jgi:ABC-type nitrate/sulfonate/bicarbonate transport system substrate-binding protein
MTYRSVLAVGAVVAALAGMAPAAHAQTAVKVMSFRSITTLPLFAAQAKGFFSRQGLTVEVLAAPNSREQREGLAQGRFDIVQSAADNAVAMVEAAKLDVILVAGNDSGFQYVFVQPDIGSYDDIRGKNVVVDAPDTAFALLLYKVLQNNGLKRGDYTVKSVGGTTQRLEAMTKDKGNAAGLLNPPYSFQAEKAGMKNWGSTVKMLGPYQSGSTFVLRSWAQANGDTLVRYVRAFIEGSRWVRDPANKAEVVTLLADRLKLSPDVAAQSYEIAVDPVSGIVADAKFDMEGFRNALKLRAEILGTWGGSPPAPDKYVDLSYYQKALASF